MPRFVVERSFEPPLTQAELDEIEARMAPCLDIYGVRWIRSTWSADRRRMICEYDARDAAAVRRVQEEAGARFDTVWTASLLEPEA